MDMPDNGLNNIARVSPQVDERSQALLDQVVAASQEDVRRILALDINEDERRRQLSVAQAARCQELNAWLAAQHQEIAQNAKAKLQDIDREIAEMIGDGDLVTLLKDSERFPNFVRAIGSARVKSLANMLLDNWVHQASTRMKGGHIVVGLVRPEEVLDRFKEFRNYPEVVDEFFHVDTETADRCTSLMSSMEDIVKAKKLVKYGIVAVGTLAAGAAATAILGPLAGFIAMLAVVGAEVGFGTITRLVNAMAEHLGFWKTVGRAGKVQDVMTAPFRAVARFITRKG